MPWLSEATKDVISPVEVQITLDAGISVGGNPIGRRPITSKDERTWGTETSKYP